MPIVPDVHRNGVTTTLTIVATASGVLAAIFWFWSAWVSIPTIAFTFNADFSPLTNALTRQSHLSAVAAGFTGLSVICQAFAQQLSKIVIGGV